MNGLYITVDGVVGTDPKPSAWNGQPIVNFRLVTNERRFDRLQGTWADAHASWMTVSCFRDLAKNVGLSVHKGDRLIVHGKMRVKDFVGDDGHQRTVVTIDADCVGHNLIFGTTRFRPSRTADNGEEQIRAQADELIRELSAEPFEDIGTLLAERAARAEHDPEDDAADVDGDDDLDENADLNDDSDDLSDFDDANQDREGPLDGVRHPLLASLGN